MTDNFFTPSSFWSFSLETYKHEQVRKVCLQLQDEFGLNVNILLACLWAAEQGFVSLDEDIFQRINEAITPWHVQQVEVIRKFRRELKDNHGPLSDEQAKILYDSVLQLELKLEYVEQKLIEQVLSCLAIPKQDKVDTALANLARYCMFSIPVESVSVSKLIHLLLEVWLRTPLSATKVESTFQNWPHS